jgi:hypothetical protein
MIATARISSGAGLDEAGVSEPVRESARRSAQAPSVSESFPRTSVRVRESNPNHHLWNNNGTWYVHYTVHPTPLTKSRIRMSLETKSVDEARRRRDEILARASSCL